MAICVLCAIIINPIGEFPLNDDWSHSYSVKHLLDTGELKILDWSPMSLIFQIFYGVIITKIFGFSFTILRISTIILSSIGVIVAYFILKELEFREELCFLGSLLIAINPIYLNLSYTFMTDVPFLTFTSLAILFYIKGFKTHSNTLLFTGAIFSTCAALIRQPGILISLAALVFAIYSKQYKIKNMCYIFLLPALSMLLYSYWLIFVNGTTNNFLISSNDIISLQNLAYKLLFRSFMFLEYMGFFLAPLIIANTNKVKKIFKSNRKIAYLSLFLIIIGVGVSLLLSYSNIGSMNDHVFSSTMPYGKNIIAKNGLGPALINGEKSPIIPNFVWIIVTVLSSVCAIIILSISKNVFKNKPENIKNFIYLFGFGQMLFFIFTYGTFDRYLLPMLLPTMVLILSVLDNKGFSRSILILGVILLGLFSITFTKEYLDWNKARWSVSKELVDSRISPNIIDGGFEFNNLYNYKKFNPEETKYEISFSVERNYSILYKKAYLSISGQKYIYALEKTVQN